MVTVAYLDAAIMEATHGKGQQKIRNDECEKRDVCEFFISGNIANKHGIKFDKK